MQSYVRDAGCSYFTKAIFFLFIVDTITDFLISYPFAHLHPGLTPPSLPSGHHHTVVCIYWLCVYVLWLIPSASFIQSTIPLSLLTGLLWKAVTVGTAQLQSIPLIQWVI